MGELPRTLFSSSQISLPRLAPSNLPPPASSHAGRPRTSWQSPAWRRQIGSSQVRALYVDPQSETSPPLTLNLYHFN